MHSELAIHGSLERDQPKHWKLESARADSLNLFPPRFLEVLTFTTVNTPRLAEVPESM